MNPLQTELRRLYAPVPAPHANPQGDVRATSLVGADGSVRCMVLALSGATGWRQLARVWQGVQAELDLPAPAIAVSGTDALQLWFSLARPVPVAEAHAFLAALRMRYLPEADARRIRLWPTADPAVAPEERHARWIPAPQAPGDNWSAFVAPDLAPVFADTPWLDIPPGDEGQATLLRGLARMSPEAFADAVQKIAPVAPAVPVPAAQAPLPTPAGPDGAEAPSPADGANRTAGADPRRFLEQVMQDEAVPMALRIEAARVLLQAPPGMAPPNAA